jgi:xanthine/uracil permease
LVTGELEQRYGRKRTLSDTQKYVAVAIALLLGTLASYAVFRNSQHPIQYANGNFQVVSNTQVLISFEVDKPRTWTVTCAIRSRNAIGAEVGRRTVTIAPGRKVNRLTEALTTTDRAVTGEVEECARS